MWSIAIVAKPHVLYSHSVSTRYDDSIYSIGLIQYELRRFKYGDVAFDVIQFTLHEFQKDERKKTFDKK